MRGVNNNHIISLKMRKYKYPCRFLGLTVDEHCGCKMLLPSLCRAWFILAYRAWIFTLQLDSFNVVRNLWMSAQRLVYARVQAWKSCKQFVLWWRIHPSLNIRVWPSLKRAWRLRQQVKSSWLFSPSMNTLLEFEHVANNIRAWTCSGFGSNILPPQKCILAYSHREGLLTFLWYIFWELCP